MRDRHAPLSHRSGFPILQRPDAAILPALPEVRRRCFREGAPLPKNIALIPCSHAWRSASPCRAVFEK
jgi:hypothetical protein